MEPWIGKAEPMTIRPRPPKSQECLLAMDRAVEAAASSRRIDSAAAPCPKKWIEVTLTGEDGEPVMLGVCRLLVADAAGSGTLRDGASRFEGQSTNATRAMLNVRKELRPGAEPIFHIDVVPLKEEPGRPPETEPDDEEVLYFQVPWEKDLARP
jgi:hypothetical protein